MFDLNELRGCDFANISLDTANKAKSEFQSLFRGDADLERVFRPRPTPKWIQIDLRAMVERSLSDGIGHLIGNAPTLGALGYHTEFFCHYFTLFWKNSSDELKSKLRGRLFQGGQDRRQLVSLYFEFMVGFAYLRKRAYVRAPVEAEGSYDYEISGTSRNYAIEVKTIDFDSGFPFDTSQMHRQMGRLHAYLDNEPDRWPEYHVHIKYIGGRRPPGHLLEGEINSAIKHLKTGRGVYSGRLVEIAVTRGAIFKNVPLEQLNDEAAKQGFNLVSRSETPSRYGEVVVTTILPWKISEEVAKLIKEVSNEQLPPDRESAIWIYIVGAQALRGIEAEMQRQLFNPNTPAGKEMQKKRRSDVVAIHFGGDPWTFVWDDDQNMIALQFGHFMLSSKPESFARYRSEVFNGNELNWAT